MNIDRIIQLIDCEIQRKFAMAKLDTVRRAELLEVAEALQAENELFKAMKGETTNATRRHGISLPIGISGSCAEQ